MTNKPQAHDVGLPKGSPSGSASQEEIATSKGAASSRDEVAPEAQSRGKVRRRPQKTQGEKSVSKRGKKREQEEVMERRYQQSEASLDRLEKQVDALSSQLSLQLERDSR